MQRKQLTYNPWEHKLVKFSNGKWAIGLKGKISGACLDNSTEYYSWHMREHIKDYCLFDSASEALAFVGLKLKNEP